MSPKYLRQKKDSKHALSFRKTVLRKLNDPNNTDDPNWLKATLDHIDARLKKKEVAKAHKRTQKKIGRQRVAKRVDRLD